jgi:hypothetical protein
MRLAKLGENKKGMYEYILTKSVMLIFILGLVGIFYTLYSNLNVRSAADIAKSEAMRVAKEIDDAINFKGVSNTITVHLKRDLKVGRDIVPYTLEVGETGAVIIRFNDYPYQDTVGVAKFGINLVKQPGVSDNIECDWSEIQRGASITVIKNSDYYYDPNAVSSAGEQGVLFYRVSLKLDASLSCNNYIEFEAEFEET